MKIMVFFHIFIFNITRSCNSNVCYFVLADEACARHAKRPIVGFIVPVLLTRRLKILIRAQVAALFQLLRLH